MFTLKYRRALLDAQVTEELLRISQAIQEPRDQDRVPGDRLQSYPSAILSICNPIHLLCAAPPTLAPSDIVRIYKSITARELFKALPRLRRELWGGAFWSSGAIWSGGAFWSGGYFVSTVGQRGGYEAIKR